jgi:hypothetical protein
MKHLSEFIHSFDLARAQPLTALVEETPPFALGVAFGVLNEDFCLYLADERELPAARDLPDGQAGDPEAGFPITGTLVLNLPETTYQVSCFDPKSGLYSPAMTVQGGRHTSVTLPAFVHDLAIRFTRIAT